ncbi:hypothetical protein KKC91_06175 [bacterium]|nr:hypothetical protein [bacterium]
MQNSIQKIIDGIKSGYIFDSHFVIAQLIKFYSDAYLDFASSINASSDKTLMVHGKIGQEIAKHKGSLIQMLPNKSWSENIHGNTNECACWQKK